MATLKNLTQQWVILNVDQTFSKAHFMDQGRLDGQHLKTWLSKSILNTMDGICGEPASPLVFPHSNYIDGEQNNMDPVGIHTWRAGALGSVVLHFLLTHQLYWFWVAHKKKWGQAQGYFPEVARGGVPGLQMLPDASDMEFKHFNKIKARLWPEQERRKNPLQTVISRVRVTVVTFAREPPEGEVMVQNSMQRVSHEEGQPCDTHRFQANAFKRSSCIKARKKGPSEGLIILEPPESRCGFVDTH